MHRVYDTETAIMTGDRTFGWRGVNTDIAYEVRRVTSNR
jgi:hypothetical protein